MHVARPVAAPRLPDLPVVPAFIMAPLGDQGRVVPVAAPRVPDQPVVPEFIMEPFGDRARDVPTPSLQSIPNSHGVPLPTLDAPATISGATPCSQDPAVNRDGYDDYSVGQPISSITWRPDKCRI